MVVREEVVMKVFLGGPIQFMIEDPVLLERMKRAVRRLVRTLQDAGMEVFSAHLVESFGATTADWQPHSIAERDLDWMRRCDVFVALLPSDGTGDLGRTDGTHVELGWASAMSKPIVLVTESRLAHRYSQLVQGLHAVASVRRVELDELLGAPSSLVPVVREVHSAGARQAELRRAV